MPRLVASAKESPSSARTFVVLATRILLMVVLMAPSLNLSWRFFCELRGGGDREVRLRGWGIVFPAPSPPPPSSPPPPKGAGVLATRNVRGCGREAGCALGVGGHPVRFSEGMPEPSLHFVVTVEAPRSHTSGRLV